MDRTTNSLGSKELKSLKSLWEAWKRIANKVASAQARILMGVFYFILLAPFALVLRLTSDPLAMKPGSQCGWRVKDKEEGSPMATAAKQS